MISFCTAGMLAGRLKLLHTPPAEGLEPKPRIGMPFHLAQINVALARDALDTPIMAGFTSRLAEINQLAESSPGFIWRLEENGDATSIQISDDPRLLVNMSVWENLDLLRQFAYQSRHVELLRARAQWFEALGAMHQALWWIPAGHVPTVAEGLARLQHIRDHGPSATAFTFGKPFPAP